MDYVVAIWWQDMYLWQILWGSRDPASKRSNKQTILEKKKKDVTFLFLTSQYDHVYSPDEAPRPADQKERDGAELHSTNHEVNAEYGHRFVFARRHPALATAEC